jgi:hypothetical protein
VCYQRYDDRPVPGCRSIATSGRDPSRICFPNNAKCYGIARRRIVFIRSGIVLAEERKRY